MNQNPNVNPSSNIPSLFSVNIQKTPPMLVNRPQFPNPIQRQNSNTNLQQVTSNNAPKPLMSLMSIITPQPTNLINFLPNNNNKPTKIDNYVYRSPSANSD